MAFFIPSIQFFFGLPRALFCFVLFFLLTIDKASLVFLIVRDVCFRSTDEIGMDQEMTCLIELKSLAFKK